MVGWLVGLWHINHCELFNAEFSLYMYIYAKCIRLVNVYFVENIFSKLELIFLHTAE